MSMTVFNFLGAACISVHEFNFDISYRNMAVLGFDYAALSYGFIVPFVTWLHSDIWQHETRKMIKSVRNLFSVRKKAVEPIDRSAVDLRNTFGEHMIIEVNNEANVHFDQLRRQWKI
ncbi:hypothetical protein WR25_21553 [Diploscapter pachys]|uniref:Uncharacterized protein n=1 Tax=Diploscapter pachys TaxID=2018661 RepID=A0A2A2JP20_9BILA|nr:hypothetical protein WR25_21553 [Diploscapter pachys]